MSCCPPNTPPTYAPTLTIAQFMTRFGSFFTNVKPQQVAYVITEAARIVDPQVYRQLTNDAIAYRAAHLLAIDPAGGDTRLVAKDGTTTFEKSFNELREAMTFGAASSGSGWVCGGEPVFPFEPNFGLPAAFQCPQPVEQPVTRCLDNCEGQLTVWGTQTIYCKPCWEYICDPAAGPITLIFPILALGQHITVNATQGSTHGVVYATFSITVIAVNTQPLEQPPPNNTQPPVARYVIGGPSATSGNGANDAGTVITWKNGGTDNALATD
jgi:hypothetical protein